MRLVKVAVLPNLNKIKSIKYVENVVKKLLSYKCEVLMDLRFQNYLSIGKNITFRSFFSVLSQSDIIIIMGGDGSIIHAAKNAARYNKPVLGINCGRVGFVASLEMNELESLKKLVNGKFKIEKRMMIDVKITNQIKGYKKLFTVLNDAVISRGATSRLLDLAVRSNGEDIVNYRADGVIISTPTGSTAYSLSAGGPILDPVIKCILLNPICSHSLFSRPIIFNENSVFSINLPKNYNNDVFITIDGGKFLKLSNNDVINFSVSKTVARFIKIKDTSFYEVLNSKLNKTKF